MTKNEKLAKAYDDLKTVEAMRRFSKGRDLKALTTKRNKIAAQILTLEQSGAVVEAWLARR